MSSLLPADVRPRPNRPRLAPGNGRWKNDGGAEWFAMEYKRIRREVIELNATFVEPGHVFDAGRVIMLNELFDALPEYSTSLPTGVFEDKFWKTKCPDGWHVCCYAAPSVTKVPGVVDVKRWKVLSVY